MAAPPSRLLALPDELLDHIIAYIPLQSFLGCVLTCRRFYNLASNSLQWRRHCLARYRYWKRSHNFSAILSDPPARINWKQLFIQRRNTDASVLQKLDQLISSQSGRIAIIEAILSTEYDAKDVLRTQLNVDDSAEDVLARRYWASEALGCLERSQALDEWDRLSFRPHEARLERVLGAFDIIIAQKPPESLDQICEHLDVLARQFEQKNPNHAESPAREKAHAVANFLHSKRIIGGNLQPAGMLSERVFRRLQNALISIVLCDGNHQSIPIISVTIFCCVAQRLGLAAAPCAFPGRVIAAITLSSGSVSDTQAAQEETMYLDVWERVKEVTTLQLRRQLSDTWGYNQDRQALILQPAPPGEIMARNMRNIHESLSTNNDHITTLESPSPEALSLLHPYSTPADIDRTSLRTTLNPDRALYAVAWCTFFHDRQFNNNDDAIRGPLAHLAAALRDDFRFDISLFQKYLQPAFQTPSAQSFGQSLVQEVRDEDATKPIVKQRKGAATSRVRYRVGQIFRHRRYAYLAAITGWDTRCQAGEHWIHHRRIDSLSGGREQCFYHVLVEDESMRYVAEENIEICNSNVVDPSSSPEPITPPEGLMRLAGKYFKRWDSSRGEFISNLRDEYPDD